MTEEKPSTLREWIIGTLFLGGIILSFFIFPSLWTDNVETKSNINDNSATPENCAKIYVKPGDPVFRVKEIQTSQGKKIICSQQE